MNAKSWLLDLHLLGTQIPADDAYHAYPNERDSYEVEDLVKASVRQQAKLGTPWVMTPGESVVSASPSPKRMRWLSGSRSPRRWDNRLRWW